MVVGSRPMLKVFNFFNMTYKVMKLFQVYLEKIFLNTGSFLLSDEIISVFSKLPGNSQWDLGQCTFSTLTFEFANTVCVNSTLSCMHSVEFFDYSSGKKLGALSHGSES
jgi:hypothetical protein